VEVAWAKTRGIDLDAHKDSQRWIIEIKGSGSLQPMCVNYFIGVLRELLQRMNDPKARYSIAFPDLKQFRNLWARLPLLAQERELKSALFSFRKLEELKRSRNRSDGVCTKID
jgi:hypothetical protein